MTKILVVDDSSYARRELTTWLSGHEVMEAENGVQALAMARETCFDLVITDVNMPGMGGIELARLLRALPEYAEVPIFAVTTESGVEPVRRGKVAGVTAWIVKPVNPQLFQRAVASVL